VVAAWLYGRDFQLEYRDRRVRPKKEKHESGYERKSHHRPQIALL